VLFLKKGIQKGYPLRKASKASTFCRRKSFKKQDLAIHDAACHESKRVHPEVFEPPALGSEDRIAPAVSRLPDSSLRQIRPISAAPQQHFGGLPCPELATHDVDQAFNPIENLPQVGNDFRSLSRLIAAWPALPDHARATILQIANVLSLPPNG